MLVWKQFRVRKIDSTNILLKGMNTELTIIPGGLTKKLQPLDLSIYKQFKNCMQEEINGQ